MCINIFLFLNIYIFVLENKLLIIMKNSIFFGLMLMCIYSFSQVGIDTETPNDAAILDIVSNEK